MKDPNNPTPKEIRQWAYHKTKNEPIRDWNIVISTLGNAELLLALAEDKSCPKRQYFLECLYLLVGNSVSKHRATDAGKVEVYLARAEKSSEPAIVNWVTRSREILRDLRRFDYAEWCEGGLAKKDMPLAAVEA